MESEKRTKEAQRNIRTYLDDEFIKKITPDENIIKILEKNAQEEALAGIKVNEIVSSFDLERKKRGIFQYNTSEKIKESKALTSLERARKFVFSMKGLLE